MTIAIWEASSKYLLQISGLLGVSANELSEALLTRVIAAAGQVMRKPHGVTEAAVSLDSFAKALYDRLFTWYAQMKHLEMIHVLKMLK